MITAALQRELRDRPSCSRGYGAHKPDSAGEDGWPVLPPDRVMQPLTAQEVHELGLDEGEKYYKGMGTSRGKGVDQQYECAVRSALKGKVSEDELLLYVGGKRMYRATLVTGNSRAGVDPDRCCHATGHQLPGCLERYNIIKNPSLRERSLPGRITVDRLLGRIETGEPAVILGSSAPPESGGALGAKVIKKLDHIETLLPNPPAPPAKQPYRTVTDDGQFLIYETRTDGLCGYHAAAESLTRVLGREVTIEEVMTSAHQSRKNPKFSVFFSSDSSVNHHSNFTGKKSTVSRNAALKGASPQLLKKPKRKIVSFHLPTFRA